MVKASAAASGLPAEGEVLGHASYVSRCVAPVLTGYCDMLLQGCCSVFQSIGDVGEHGGHAGPPMDKFGSALVVVLSDATVQRPGAQVNEQVIAAAIPRDGHERSREVQSSCTAEATR